MPWQKQPKNDLHRLLDVLTQLPTLLYTSSQLSVAQRVGSRTSDQVELFHLLHGHLNWNLDQWLSELKASRTQPIYWNKPAASPTPTSSRNSSGGKDSPAKPTIIGAQLCYFTLVDSQMLTIYWEAKLHCHEVARRMAKVGNPYPSGVQAGLSKPSIEALQDCADKICLSTAYMQHQGHGILGLHLTIYHILAARQFYQQVGAQEKYACCTGLIEKMARRPFSIFSVH